MRRARILDAAPAGARHSRRDRALEGRARGDARARAPRRRSRRSRAFCARPGLSRSTEAHVQSDPKKGDFYVAHHRRSRAGRRRTSSPSSCRPIIRAFPWPKSMRWGAGVGQAGAQPALGAPAAVDRLHLRAGDRGAGGGRLRGRRHPLRQRHLWPPLPCAGRRSRCAASTTMSPSSRRPRSCSTPTAARRSSSPTPGTSPSPAGSNWSRTRGCWRRSSGLVEWPVVLMGEFEERLPGDPGRGRSG